MQLVIPSTIYKDSFLEAFEEYQSDPPGRREWYNTHFQNINENFDAYVQMLLDMAEGKNLPPGYVPQTTYWLVDNHKVLGTVSIRHTLSEELLKAGGHIGYDIRPSERNKGYGKKILASALPKAKELGIKKALVTCDEDNIGSKKIIEANGGVLENSVDMGESKPRKLRYWISIK